MYSISYKSLSLLSVTACIIFPTTVTHTYYLVDPHGGSVGAAVRPCHFGYLPVMTELMSPSHRRLFFFSFTEQLDSDT